MLHAKILRSPYAHARILDIDSRTAELMAGVHAVLTFRDAPKTRYNPVLFSYLGGDWLVKDMVILDETVRYVGQPVAVVAAADEDTAEEALEQIRVDYQELSAVFIVEEALNEGAPLVHEAPRNIAQKVEFGMGDVEAGFAGSDRIFEGRYTTQRVHGCPLEPHVALCRPDPDGGITLWSSTQGVHPLRGLLALALEMPVSKVRVVKPPYIGGGFGAKLDMSVEPLVALLALKAGRPVRLELSRGEEFLWAHRHPFLITLKTGITRDGTILARQAEAIVECGAHSTHSQHIARVAGSTFVSQYKTPHLRYHALCVYTNIVPCGGFRGYGGPQIAFAVESQIDEIAAELGMDPLELRLKNAYQVGDKNPKGPFPITSLALRECVERGAERIGWHRWRRRQKENAGEAKLREGVGAAFCPIWVSGTLGSPGVMENTGAIVKINEDGSVSVSVATVDQGGGQSTVLSQIVAEELGVPLSWVTIVRGDTDTTLYEPPTHATRGTYVAGYGVRAAARDAKRKVLDLAAKLLEVEAARLVLREGRISVEGDPQKSMSLAEVARTALASWLVPGSRGPRYTPLEKGSIVGVFAGPPPNSPPACAVQFVKVAVDTETGEVKLLQVVSAHDVGKAINPTGVEGQVEGGFQQGMGYALLEEVWVDRKTGVLVNGDFLDYKMPTAVEMPPVETVIVESEDPTGPFGAKGLSEPCIIVPAPAIANALCDALGVRFRELPITPEKVLKALGRIP
jgi:xanthine dehydrogenase molybdenum-binding subunit